MGMKRIGFHVTTEKKLSKYIESGAIHPPVRFWPNIFTAANWANKTGRDIILKIECTDSHPMPDHVPARWTPQIIREWEQLEKREWDRKRT